MFKIILISISLLLISVFSQAQDKRTIETRVADLLARLPANDQQFTGKLMVDMMSLGETGIRQICDKVIPAMLKVRAAADALEEIVSDEYWPLPSYQELLYLR